MELEETAMMWTLQLQGHWNLDSMHWFLERIQIYAPATIRKAWARTTSGSETFPSLSDMLLPSSGDAQNVKQVLRYSQTQAACPVEGQLAAGVQVIAGSNGSRLVTKVQQGG